jgi:hypothetical protein
MENLKINLNEFNLDGEIEFMTTVHCTNFNIFNKICFLVGLFFIHSGLLAKNVALIIGNSNYHYSSMLKNPLNDSLLVSASLKAAGFDEIKIVNDANFAKMNETLREFALLSSDAEIAIIYYAGHGIESKGQNWLIPTDARLKTDTDLSYEAIEVNNAMKSMQGAKTKILVIDACRDNPFSRTWQARTRSISRGLSAIEADDIFVILSAAPGQVAEDGEGSNSPFAVSFAKRISEPEAVLQFLGGLIRDDVLRATAGFQRPYVSASITGSPVYIRKNIAPNIQKFSDNKMAIRDNLIQNRYQKSEFYAFNMMFVPAELAREILSARIIRNNAERIERECKILKDKIQDQVNIAMALNEGGFTDTHYRGPVSGLKGWMYLGQSFTNENRSQITVEGLGVLIDPEGNKVYCHRAKEARLACSGIAYVNMIQGKGIIEVFCIDSRSEKYSLNDVAYVKYWGNSILNDTLDQAWIQRDHLNENMKFEEIDPLKNSSGIKKGVFLLKNGFTIEGSIRQDKTGKFVGSGGTIVWDEKGKIIEASKITRGKQIILPLPKHPALQ